MKELLKVKKLSTFNQTNINLKNMDFILNKGEIHALVGERGTGKNVFVDVLSGFYKDDMTGDVYFKEELVNNKLIARKSSSIMFLLSESLLADSLTVAENIYTMRDQKNIFKYIRKSKIVNSTKEAFKEMNVFVDPKRLVRNLDNEEKKLVELAKIYMYNPKVLVMYEPTIQMSPPTRSYFYEFLKKMKERGTSIIYATSLWEEAIRTADRISVLYNGSVVGTMDADEAKKEPEELLNMVSGWHKNPNSDQERKIDMGEGSYIKTSEEIINEELLDAIFKAAEYLTSNYEIKDVLKMLEKTSCKIMRSDGCNVYLINETPKKIMDIVKYNNRKDIEAELTDEAVLKIMDEDKLYYKNYNDKNFSFMFNRLKNAKTIICYPVLIRSQYTALIQVYYKEYYKQSPEQLKYLSAISKQVAIAIDNTRLMGRSALLKESHHRIKNNLQTIVSIINLQKSNFKRNPEKGINVLIDDIVSRVKSIAAVHDLLSKNEGGGSIINLKTLIEAIINFYTLEKESKIKAYLDDIFIPYNLATSIALVINELVNNCVKHAFDDNYNNAIIKIVCCIVNDNVSINIEDNGKGLPRNFSYKKANNLGLFLVHTLIENEFHGTFEIFGVDGTTANILIPKENLSISKG
jgi:ribose transport system ATP-binding protein